MTKFKLEEKIKAITEYLQGYKSFITLAKELETSTAVIRNWVKQYEHHGINALNTTYTNYPVEFKLDVLNYMIDNGTSPNETAAIFNIPEPSTIRRWRNVFKKQGIDGLIIKIKGRPSMKKETKKSTQPKGALEELQEEIERLRMENAYLKKLNTLVQNKEKSPNKTRRK